jgi:hypothetical protein
MYDATMYPLLRRPTVIECPLIRGGPCLLHFEIQDVLEQEEEGRGEDPGPGATFDPTAPGQEQARRPTKGNGILPRTTTTTCDGARLQSARLPKAIGHGG